MTGSLSPIPVAIAVVVLDDQVLIGRRGESGPLAGYWEFPGGKIHLDESPAAACARETMEETGLAVIVDRLLLEHQEHYDHGQVHLHFFLCRATPCLSSMKEPDENTEANQLNQPPAAHLPKPRPPFRWVRLNQLDQYTFPRGNDSILERLKQFPAGTASGTDSAS